MGERDMTKRLNMTCWWLSFVLYTYGFFFSENKILQNSYHVLDAQ